MKTSMSSGVAMHIGATTAAFMVVLLTAFGRLGKGPWSTLAIWAGVLGVLYLATKPGTWLPVLGEAALPPTLLKVGTPENASQSTTIRVPKDVVYVAYWGASPNQSAFDSPQKAYANYDNAGVARVVQGVATLRFNCPGAYRVPYGGLLPKHVHMRFVYANGIMSRVHTKELTC